VHHKSNGICKYVEENGMGENGMIDNAKAEAIMSAGMACLVEKLGVVGAEMFLSIVREHTFDYTEWRRDNLWQGMSISEIFELAAEREKSRDVLTK
jgi:hypothetical protein